MHYAMSPTIPLLVRVAAYVCVSHDSFICVCVTCLTPMHDMTHVYVCDMTHMCVCVWRDSFIFVCVCVTCLTPMRDMPHVYVCDMTHFMCVCAT